jgi:hypothetical protein
VTAPDGPGERLLAAADAVERFGVVVCDCGREPCSASVANAVLAWQPSLAAWLRAEAGVADLASRAVEAGIMRVTLSSTVEALAFADVILGDPGR